MVVSGRVLVVPEPEQSLTAGLAERLSASVERVTDPDSIEAQIPAGDVEGIVAGQRLPDRSGLALLEWVRDRWPDLPFVLATAHGSEQLASDAMAAGVSDYVPLSDGDDAVAMLAARVQTAIEEAQADARNRQQYETIVETVPEGVFVLDEESRIVGGNQTGAEMLGFESRAEALGRQIPELVEAGIFHVEVVEPYLELVPDLLSDSSDTEMGSFEFRVFPGTDDERIMEARITLRPYDDEFRGTIGVLRDITERKRRQEELEWYGTIIDAVPSPVYAIDEDGMFLFINEAMAEVTGYSSEQTQERGIYIGMTEDGIERSREVIRELLSDDSPVEKRTFEHDLITKDGRAIPVENHMALLPYDEAFSGVAGIFRDVSDQKQRQRRLDVLNTVLRHTLRNDMDAITGYADLIDYRSDDPDIVQPVEQIKAQAHDLAAMSDEVRHLQAAVDRDDSTLETLAVDAVVITDTVVAEFDSAGSSLSIRTSIPAEAWVVADHTLRRVLVDLVGNAIEHNDADHPEVSIEIEPGQDPPQAAVETDPSEGQWVALSVADNGPGIPEYERELVTGQREITPLRHGSGLGLWVVAWIVDSFGGDVTITDNDPRGTVVTLWLQQARRGTD